MQERRVFASYLTYLNWFAIQLKLNSFLVLIFDNIPFLIKGFWEQLKCNFDSFYSLL